MPISPARPWPALAANTLADQAYAALRDRILSGDLAAGEFVREQEVCEMLGVSRTPVREALGRLASEGLLEKIPHRGFRVPENSIRRLEELYPIVSALELLAGRLAFPNVRPEDLSALRKCNEALQRALDSCDADAALHQNERFHSLIGELSGNQRLSEQLGELRSQLRPLERWYYMDAEQAQKSVEEHQSLIDSIETGDLQGALAIVERNMALTLVSLRRQTRRVTGKPDS